MTDAMDSEVIAKSAKKERKQEKLKCEAALVIIEEEVGTALLEVDVVPNKKNKKRKPSHVDEHHGHDHTSATDIVTTIPKTNAGEDPELKSELKKEKKKKKNRAEVSPATGSAPVPSSSSMNALPPTVTAAGWNNWGASEFKDTTQKSKFLRLVLHNHNSYPTLTVTRNHFLTQPDGHGQTRCVE